MSSHKTNIVNIKRVGNLVGNRGINQQHRGEYPLRQEFIGLDENKIMKSFTREIEFGKMKSAT